MTLVKCTYSPIIGVSLRAKVRLVRAEERSYDNSHHPFQLMSDTKVTMDAPARPEDWARGERNAEDGKMELMGSTKKPQPSVSMRITLGSGSNLS
jgi:hypothetical protein